MKKLVEKQNKEGRATRSGKERYIKPVLVSFGPIREQTAGPSFGVGESGNPLIYKP